MTRIIKSTLIVVLVILVSISCEQPKEKTVDLVNEIESTNNIRALNEANKENAVESTESIPAELVCMVNDAFMGRKQFPVPVGDKIYYGCCENCVSKLQDSEQYRYGVDPLTNEKVDKVEAYIVLASEETGAVYYFASEENYKKFKSKS